MANFFQNIFGKKTEAPQAEEKLETRDSSYTLADAVTGTMSYNNTSNFRSDKATNLSTVYRCLALLSDSIASLPMYPYIINNGWKYRDDTNILNNLLNIQPNSYQSAFMFKKMIVINKHTKGNAFIAIEKSNSGIVLSLTLLNSDYVFIYVNGVIITENTDLTTLIAGGDVNITYYNALNHRVYDKSQIIHIPNYTKSDGILGVSTIQYAADALGATYNTNQHSNNFFLGGANLSGVLSPKAGAQLQQGQAAKAKQDFIAQTNPIMGGLSNGIVALDAGLEYNPISVNPRDSLLLENKAFNVLEICRFFGVPPSLAFSETAKYSTSEQQSLDFLNNGLLPQIEIIENEFRRKIYLPSEWSTTDLKFDTENIMRLDAETKADTLAKLVGIGAKTPNEARAQYNSNFPVAGGNKAFISTNLQDLQNPVVKGTVPGSETPQNADTQVNNTNNN
jgi:HK97 family phage portal protein